MKKTAAAKKATRRPRGAPRRLLLEAASSLFAEQDYRSTTTREIAEEAGVAEHLLFRNFGSKAALFREALVVPFLQVVDDFAGVWDSIPEDSSVEEIARRLLGRLYDLFVQNRGLVMTLLAADALDEQELSETGIRDIGRALEVLGGIGADGISRLGMQASHHDLAARSTVAMVAGMAAFGSSLFSGRQPSRDAVVEELVQATLHGFLHRSSSS